MSGIVGSKLNIRGSGPVAKLGTDGQHFLSSGAGTSANYETIASTAFDDDKIQSNIALLGFKTAVNGSLAKYNLVDQIVDEYSDATGVDASASTNEFLVSGVYTGGTAISVPTGATSTDTSVTGKTIQVLSAGSGNLVIGGNMTVDILVVAGGGAGGESYAGGAGAGGLIYKGSHALTAQTYAWVTGAGAAQNSTNDSKGASGSDSTFTRADSTVEFTAKGGGGGGGEYTWAGLTGGSAGGTSYGSGGGVAATQTSQSGDSGTYGFGNASGGGSQSGLNAGGGGGAGSAGIAATSSKSGNGGTGKDYSAIFGTAVGDSGWFASGGGGADTSGVATVGTASAGGGTDGAGDNSTRTDAATANTGGGSGGGNDAGSGAGGSGIILIRHDTPLFTPGNNLTLQSNDTTASTADPDYADMIVLMENVEGTATLDTDIKGYISEDSGVTFTQGNLVEEGTWGTDKKIIAFHDLDISAQSGSAMCYKITTHNQSAGSKETKIHATSIGWK